MDETPQRRSGGDSSPQRCRVLVRRQHRQVDKRGCRCALRGLHRWRQRNNRSRRFRDRADCHSGAGASRRRPRTWACRNWCRWAAPMGRWKTSTISAGSWCVRFAKCGPMSWVCPEPYRKNLAWHRDHRIAGQVALDAVFPCARDHLHFEELWRDEGLEPHKTGTVLFWGTETPNTFVGIDPSIGSKTRAVKANKSPVVGPHR